MLNEQQNALWDKIRKKSKMVEESMAPLERKRTGSYYTGLDLTDSMMAELVDYIIKSGKDIRYMTFLEPCVGTGNFIFSYLKILSQKNFTRVDYETILNNIYVADINEAALNQYKSLLIQFAKTYFNIDLFENYFNEHIGGGLLLDVDDEFPHYIPIKNVFDPSVIKEGFDIVVTNPPYKNLKAETGHYTNSDDYEIDKSKYSQLSKIIDNHFIYSNYGVLNLYKIFMEEILDHYTNPNSIVSLLVPSSIMSDKTSEKLRTHILFDSALVSIKVIREGSGYVDAQQALCSVLIDKSKTSNIIKVTKDFVNAPSDIAYVNISDIINPNNGNAIIALNNEEYRILQKIKNYPTIRDLEFIINLRGELDLTANKRFIVQEETAYPLLRGRNIGFYELLNVNTCDYVNPDFVNLTKKEKYIHQPRIICQQIANMHKERRVTFAYTESNVVLGNSCNFIVVDQNPYGIDLFAMLGLLNSSIINWFFKLTSSNNHINNYEIDCFPIPIGSDQFPILSSLVKNYIKSRDSSILTEIELCVARAYGLAQDTQGSNKSISKKLMENYYSDLQSIIPSLSNDNAMYLFNGDTNSEDILTEYDVPSKNKMNIAVINGIVDKYRKLSAGKILNHTTFKLSPLDLEMIKAVPPGGSWKDIPQETVEKSNRLKRITETGGRTTLYGRIDYDKPSYTITTYFNRPGNGTYVHPNHDRVISVREAARLQTFKDDYYFYGNKNQQLKQIGNAVPTILAYQIASRIKQETGCSKSIDLFCGAGGMTVGFKAAGIESLISNDIEESACITLKINNPEIPVLCGDITKAETKDIIEAAAKKGDADIICGGPPCQGFSMAGFRSPDDPRNQLFREFVDLVKRINPKVIVFENVEGLLSFQGGRTYNEVHSLFSELGYYTEGRKLMASDFAVPQKRKRVIIICTRKDLGIYPSKLYPQPITPDPENQITAREALFDLDTVPCSEDAFYTDDNFQSNLLKFLKGEITYQEYINIYSNYQHTSGTYEQLSFDFT